MNKHYLVYKYKEYDENENITNQSKSKVEILKIEEAKIFLNALGYRKLIVVNDQVDVYEKDELQLAVEYVNEKYLYIEVEENEKYNTIEKLIDGLESTKINYDKTNYFVKKAKIIFEEKYRNNH